nr:MAG: VP2 [Bat faecal sapovirus]
MGSWGQALAVIAGGAGDFAGGVLSGVSSIINAHQNQQFLRQQQQYMEHSLQLQQRALDIQERNTPLNLYSEALQMGFTNSGAQQLAGSNVRHIVGGSLMSPMRVTDVAGLQNAHLSATFGAGLRMANSGVRGASVAPARPSFPTGLSPGSSSV